MTDEKSNSLMADLNTDLNEPASPDDVNEVNSRKAGCTEPEQKTDQSAKIDLPDPDLTRLFKNRARDGLALYRNHKNENDIAKSERRNRGHVAGENSRATGRRTTAGR
ncbi:hypothetical protein ACIAET_13315, partial [Klebsiella quasipneumoniae subsp. similipneumoniae]